MAPRAWWWVFYCPHDTYNKTPWKIGFKDWWTANTKTREGDYAFLYVRAPISALVGLFEVVSDARRDDAVRASWHHPWVSNVRVECLFEQPLKLTTMRNDEELWKEWGLVRANFQAPSGAPPRVPLEVLPILAKYIPVLQPYVHISSR